jgi:hypothetical protein
VADFEAISARNRLSITYFGLKSWVLSKPLFWRQCCGKLQQCRQKYNYFFIVIERESAFSILTTLIG